MNLLVTGAWNCNENQLSRLRALGNDIVFMQFEQDELPCPVGEIEGVICNGLFLYHEIRTFRNLKYIQLTSAGFDRVPLDYIRLNGITIHNAHGVYSKPMAEFAICGVLQLYKHSRFFYENQKKHKWEKRRDLLELDDKTVLIVGCGSVGTECAKRFKAFDCNVIGVDLCPYRNDFFNEMHGFCNLNDSLPKADIVILSAPLTDDTRKMFDNQRFSQMKNGSVFINLSRGELVSTDALIQFLANGLLLGAVLDVFESEPLEYGSKLWTMENVVLTPHNSFIGDENEKRLYRIILSNLENANEIN